MWRDKAGDTIQVSGNIILFTLGYEHFRGGRGTEDIEVREINY